MSVGHFHKCISATAWLHNFSLNYCNHCILYSLFFLHICILLQGNPRWISFFVICISLLLKLWHIWRPANLKLFLCDRIVKPPPVNNSIQAQNQKTFLSFFSSSIKFLSIFLHVFLNKYLCDCIVKTFLSTTQSTKPKTRKSCSISIIKQTQSCKM